MERVGKTPLDHVAADLQRIFGARLEAVVGYGWRPRDRQPSLALVTSLTMDDLASCAARTSSWHRAGCATPLLLTPHEFARSLDAFPVEYGEILATSHVVVGNHPFEGLSIAREDLRRGCEVQVKSHLLHLREEYLEGGGHPRTVAAIVRESVPAFAAVLRHLARLDAVPAASDQELVAYADQRIGLDTRIVADVLALDDPGAMNAVDAAKLFPAYLAAVEQLARFVDEWRIR